MTAVLCFLVVCLSALAGLVMVLRHRERLLTQRDAALLQVQAEAKRLEERVRTLELAKAGFGR